MDDARAGLDYLAPVAEGLLITIEGVDGAGKTTLAGALRDALEARGVQAQLVREPGGVELSERLRDLLADPELHIASRTEALLYAAARAQLVQELLVPLLGEGSVVVMDRFADSSLAYQGAGRGLGIEPVRALNEFATAGLRPQRTLLLALEPELARARLDAEGRLPDRLEREPTAFFAEIARAYEQLAEAEPDRFVVLDASAPQDVVLAAALDALADLL
jgi:dTMP kinase